MPEVKVELHSHTADDPCDRIPFSTRQLIDRSAGLGYGALAVTLHDRQLDLKPHAAYAQQRGVILIPGVERTIEGKHVLLLNFEPAIAMSVETFDDLARVRRGGRGLVIAPHPFFPVAKCLGGLLDLHSDLFDAVEFNAMFTARVNFNRRAADWAAKHQKPLVGNGDVHRLPQLGTTYSLVEAAAHTPEAICDAIRLGRVRVRATPMTVFTAARLMADLLAADLRRSVSRRPLPERTDPPTASIGQHEGGR